MAKNYISQPLSYLAGNTGEIFYKAFMRGMKRNCRRKSINIFVIIMIEGNITEIGRDVYCYFNGEVAVKNHGWEEITDFEQIVNRLL